MIPGVDYETFSSVPLGGTQAKGLPNYLASPDFRVLLASAHTPEGKVTYDFVFNCIWSTDKKLDELPTDYKVATGRWTDFLESLGRGVAAHNAPFERGVTAKLDPSFDPTRFVDSAVSARAAGADSSLYMATRQLTTSHKLEEGKELVMRFCVPNELYPEGATKEKIEEHGDMDKWMLFIMYCEMDAEGSAAIEEYWRSTVGRFAPELVNNEHRFENLTFEMNQPGWPVDMSLVNKMKIRGWANSMLAQKVFLTENEEKLNFNSHPQMKAFASDRGVKITSLDKYHRPVLMENLRKRIALLHAEENGPALQLEVQKLREVLLMVETKDEMGGSALSKLPVIERLISEDGRLRDQYMHLGAGASFRTTGRGVQLQNIKKLDGDIKDISTILNPKEDWSNGNMAGQMRQVFVSSHPEGELIVGDFSGVESRGLAYQAGEEWKLQVFREGKDVYKALYSRFTKGEVPYEEVTAEQRPRGKYSELSCGYQASGKAVQDFMFRLGFKISLEEAAQNVVDWRGACPSIVDYWYGLDRILKRAVKLNQVQELDIAYGMKVRITPFSVPSIQAMHRGAISLIVQILVPMGEKDEPLTPYVTRVVHGCYFKGDKLCYYKPADYEHKSGPLWIPDYNHKTEKVMLPDGKKVPKKILYSIYGGKLAGILTQSLCREMFFDSLNLLSNELKSVPNAEIIGQFHDEIVVNWVPSTEPGAKTSEEVKEIMAKAMSTTYLRDFPLVADIKSAYRYIK